MYTIVYYILYIPDLCTINKIQYESLKAFIQRYNSEKDEQLQPNLYSILDQKIRKLIIGSKESFVFWLELIIGIVLLLHLFPIIQFLFFHMFYDLPGSLPLEWRAFLTSSLDAVF